MSERAILLGLRLPPRTSSQYKESMAELAALTRAAGARVSSTIVQSRDKPTPRTYLGKGKVQEVKEAAKEYQATLAIVNETITPSQQRHLEDSLEIRVIDRVGLILDIFARRAQTQEAKLQVELAQYEYLLPRLTRLWLHFSKQAGYIGNRGPGETQLEVDRRRIQQRIKMLKDKIRKVRRHHRITREGRRKKGARVVALVGYTNAGKSTLLNSLTAAEVLSRDQLFATLDPTLRQWPISGIQDVVLADTVGFIRDLPHELIDAFKATLDEVTTADLLLHVVDCSAKDLAGQFNAVLRVLEDIGAIQKPMILVLNKQDLIDSERKLEIEEYIQALACDYVFTDAVNKKGLESLQRVVGRILLKE
jgi:GTP-binding protein HflX